jgi:hypothetical protein
LKARLLLPVALFCGSLLFGIPSVAHHGTNTEYDSEHPMTVVGVVTEFAFVNPHVQIYFDVTDAKGNVVHWGVESASPGRLVRVGWNRNIIKPGDKLTLTFEPARSGQPVGGLKKVVFPDGRVLGGSAAPPENGGSNSNN